MRTLHMAIRWDGAMLVGVGRVDVGGHVSKVFYAVVTSAGGQPFAARLHVIEEVLWTPLGIWVWPS